MSFARPFMHLAWLAALGAVVASLAGQTFPRARHTLSPSGPVHILTQER